MYLNQQKHTLNILLIFIISLPLLVAAVPMQTDLEGPIVWVEDGLTRVFRDDPAKPNSRIFLYSAKNEYEPIQIIVKAPESNNLTNVNVTISDLHGENGH